MDRCPASWLERAASATRWGERVGRLGIHALRVHENGRATAVLRGRIIHRAGPNESWETVLHIDHGSRPLKLCQDEHGWLYFGEYFGNPDREAVHIYGSADGEHWRRVFTFPPSTIRHVHAVVYDPYRGGHWVLTGDDDDESGLWFTDDQFRTLDRVVGDTQRARAVDVIPTADDLIVPTDTPREQNYIQRMDPSTGSLNRVHPLPSSAFHAQCVNGLLIVTTVGEPSPLNDQRRATLHASLDGNHWIEITSLVRDVPAWLGVDRLVRYPEIELVPRAGRLYTSTSHTGQEEDEEEMDEKPKEGRLHDEAKGSTEAGDVEEDFPVFGFGRALRKYDGRLLRWSSAHLRRRLAETTDAAPASSPATSS